MLGVGLGETIFLTAYTLCETNADARSKKITRRAATFLTTSPIMGAEQSDLQGHPDAGANL